MKGPATLRRRQALAGLAALSAALPAAAQTAAPDWHELVVTQGRLAGGHAVIAATKGERMRWRVRSDAAGELHLHAYRVSVAVQPGRVSELEFTAHATGRFRLEWHAAQTGGGDGAKHHAPPLAMLEVRPP